MKRVKRTGNSVKVIKNNKETTPQNGTSSYSPTLWPVVSLHLFHLPLAKAVKEFLVSREIQKQLLSFRTSALSHVSVALMNIMFHHLILWLWSSVRPLNSTPPPAASPKPYPCLSMRNTVRDKPATQVQTWHMQIGKILSHNCWGSFDVMKPSPCTHIRLLQISIY